VTKMMVVTGRRQFVDRAGLITLVSRLFGFIDAIFTCHRSRLYQQGFLFFN